MKGHDQPLTFYNTLLAIFYFALDKSNKMMLQSIPDGLHTYPTLIRTVGDIRISKKDVTTNYTIRYY